MVVLGLAEELKSHKIGVNALWPKTTIATAAIQNIVGGDLMVQRSRKPEIVADAAYYILQRPAAGCTGNFFIDEEILIEQGITDFTHYAVNPSQKLMPDLFL
jgi:citronellol/citronellal dehydrogenase